MLFSRLFRRITNTSPALLAALCVLAAVLITRSFSGETRANVASPRILNAAEENAKKEVIAELRRRLKKPAIVFRSKPATAPPVGYVSCLGCVTWQLPGETQPKDDEGNPLIPLATIFVPDSPIVPEPLKGTALITVFAPTDAWAWNPVGGPRLGCVIRAYPTLEGLVPCRYSAQNLTPCILTPRTVDNDMPCYPGLGGGDDVLPLLRSAVKQFGINYFDDVRETNYEQHKIGGYPAFCQDLPDFPPGFSFAFQISNDDTAGLSILDCGRYYFYYNPKTKSWFVCADGG